MTFVATTVAAIVSALEANPPVCPVVGRVRLRPLASTVTSAVVVRPAPKAAAVQGDTEIATGYPVSWIGSYLVECYAKVPASTAPDAAVDDLLQAVYARLFSDPTLGGAVLTLDPAGISFDFDADGEQSVCAVLSINAHHRTVGASL